GSQADQDALARMYKEKIDNLMYVIQMGVAEREDIAARLHAAEAQNLANEEKLSLMDRLALQLEEVNKTLADKIQRLEGDLRQREQDYHAQRKIVRHAAAALQEEVDKVMKGMSGELSGNQMGTAQIVLHGPQGTEELQNLLLRLKALEVESERLRQLKHAFTDKSEDMCSALTQEIDRLNAKASPCDEGKDPTLEVLVRNLEEGRQFAAAGLHRLKEVAAADEIDTAAQFEIADLLEISSLLDEDGSTSDPATMLTQNKAHGADFMESTRALDLLGEVTSSVEAALKEAMEAKAQKLTDVLAEQRRLQEEVFRLNQRLKVRDEEMEELKQQQESAMEDIELANEDARLYQQELHDREAEIVSAESAVLAAEARAEAERAVAEARELEAGRLRKELSRLREIVEDGQSAQGSQPSRPPSNRPQGSAAGRSSSSAAGAPRRTSILEQRRKNPDDGGQSGQSQPPSLSIDGQEPAPGDGLHGSRSGEGGTDGALAFSQSLSPSMMLNIMDRPSTPRKKTLDRTESLENSLAKFKLEAGTAPMQGHDPMLPAKAPPPSAPNILKIEKRDSDTDDVVARVAEEEGGIHIYIKKVSAVAPMQDVCVTVRSSNKKHGTSMYQCPL
ncbi:hypothetical protein CYMTET_52317, partial [Cymbomonas tetramitiformis]